jgi:hypothetical protein
MVPVAVAGNISGEATTPSGNIFNEAMRGPMACRRVSSAQRIVARRVTAGTLLVSSRYDHSGTRAARSRAASTIYW